MVDSCVFFLPNVECRNTETAMETLLDSSLHWKLSHWTSLLPAEQLAQHEVRSRGWRNFSNVALLMRIYCNLMSVVRNFTLETKAQICWSKNNPDSCCVTWSSLFFTGQWVQLHSLEKSFPEHLILTAECVTWNCLSAVSEIHIVLQSVCFAALASICQESPCIFLIISFLFLFQHVWEIQKHFQTPCSLQAIY